ncbi:E3 ubiquitin-protein ligase TRAIP-like isoform X2 [Pararge aegeria]|uniref:No poles n=2 Tax=Pararge aegeria TaxID=116150 RepID=S4NXF0_9NEOP|nr:E3 ubiquitin-protein ligase TRAIP-like isoform X2 [Pararge aegeria]
MHILCTICSDLVNQADNLIVTKCGHIFHHNCLSKWIERSKSCPQCRNKVTESGLYRLFPTISSETEVDDVITLQSRLDDALLQLRQSHATCKENVEKCAKAEAQLAKVMTQLKTSEKQLESRETAIAAMKEQLKYLKMEITVVENLKDENEGLKKNMRTLNGLQKVLNATSEEVELMLEGYSDVRTVATFATALKRALCESESKKNDTRDRLQVTKQKLAAEKSIVADLQAKLASAEEKLSLLHRKYRGLQQKRKSDVLESSLAEESPSSAKKMRQDLNAAVLLTDSCNNSFNTMVDKIENAESPYLRLQQSSLALSALNLASQHANPAKPLSDKNLKPSEYALLNSVRNAITKKPEANKSQATSIFQKKEPTKINFTQENDPNLSLLNISYDGLGGHSKLDTFPVPNSKPNFKSCIPKLSAKHKLKRPNPVGSQDIGKMLEKIRDK